MTIDEKITAYATAASAIATSVTVIVIAFQAYVTRRSVVVSEMLLEEATLARLDETAPRITVKTRLFSETTPYFEGPADYTDPKILTSVSNDHVYQLPRDNDLNLWVRAVTTLVNVGSEPVRYRLMAGEFTGTELKPPAFLIKGTDTLASAQLLPTDSVDVHWTTGQSVKDWSQLDKLSASVAAIFIDDERDNGAIDAWPLFITAEMFHEPSDNEWQLPDTPSVRTLPRRRQYFRSKLENLVLVTRGHGATRKDKRIYLPQP